MHSSHNTSRARKIALSVLALGLASAFAIFGTMAAWTAQTTNPDNQVSAGTLVMTNDKDGLAVINAADIVPGDTGSDTVTVGNGGSVPMAVYLTQDQISASGIEPSLRLSVYDQDGDFCYYPDNAPGACSGLGDWDASATLNAAQIAGESTPTWAPGEEHTFSVSWALLGSSPNSDQGKTGSFRLVWDGTP